MKLIGKLTVVAASAALALIYASSALAVPATPTLTIEKTASVASLPVGGGSVTFTVVVTNTGKGAFHSLVVTDDMAGCTLAQTDSSDDSEYGSDALDEGEWWELSCTVNVTATVTNTADVEACTTGSAKDVPAECKGTANYASGEDSATVTVALPSNSASQAAETQCNCDADLTGAGGSSPSDASWLLVVAMGVLLASAVVLTPARVRTR